MVTILTMFLTFAIFPHSDASPPSYQPSIVNFADINEGLYDYDYPDADLLQQEKRGGYCMSYGRGCTTKGIPCCDSHTCRQMSLEETASVRVLVSLVAKQI